MAPEPSRARPDGAADPALLATLVQSHRRFLAFLEKRLGSRTMAEDVLQDAFVKGIERGGSLRADESAVAWFFRLLRNALADHHRRSGTGPFTALDDLAPDREPAAPAPETATEICRCVAALARTLEPRYAEALERVDLGGIAVKDYAREAGITANNAGVRLHRARAALARQVAVTCRTCAEHGCVDCTCGSTGRG